MRMLRWLTPLLVGALLLGSCNGPQAVVPEDGAALAAAPAGGWDLTVPEAEVNGALWLSGEAFKVGTGVINPFLSIQKKNVQEGFDTDGAFRYDQTRPNFTDALPLNVVSQIEIDGVWYRELILDANEANADPDAQFSIDEFELWLCATPDAATYEWYDDFATNTDDCRKVYDFRDEMLTGDPKVGYASDANTQGSGSDLDYHILIPEDYFGATGCYYNPAADCGVYLILWTKMGGVGGDWVVGSTFEEFSTLVREVPTGFKGGVKYHDLNGNGERDDGEPGLEGWTIELWQNGAKIAETTTDADGAYLFADLLPGDYTAKEVCPEGWIQSEPAPTGGCGSGVYDFAVFPGQLEHPGNDFGNYLPASKSGAKFNDLNANGVWDAGEPGLEGWTIVIEGSSGFSDSTTTGPDGAYAFAGLRPGNYLVREVQQAGWTQSYPAPDPDDGNQFWFFSLESGENHTGNDFGNYESVSVTACKVEDVDSDPATTADRLPVAGWIVKLSQDGVVVDAQPTGTDGCYTWDGLIPGPSYDVEEDVPDDWYAWTPTSFDFGPSVSGGEYAYTFINSERVEVTACKVEDMDGDPATTADQVRQPGWQVVLTKNGEVIDSSSTTHNGCHTWRDLEPLAPPNAYDVHEVVPEGWFALTPIDVVCDPIPSGGTCRVEFVNSQYASKSGHKWHDLNANGFWDAGEPGLPGWTIELWQGTDVLATTTTDADGAYAFSRLPPGSYTVREACPPDWYQSYPTPTDGCGSGVHDVTLQSGDADIDNDFGNYQLATKSGHKWNDLNGNGVWDPGEPGLSGWQIVLTWGDGNFSWVSTDASGAYAFDFLVPGVPYQVFEAEPNTFDSEEPDPVGLWVQTFPASGPVFGFNGTYGYDVLLASGEVHTDNDFGNWMPPMNDETAWASNELDVPGTLPYNQDGTGDWATYVAYAGEAKTVTLYAGQTIDVGTVTFSAPDAGNVDVTITLTGGWSFFGDADNVMVQDYASPPSGNPSPGLFDRKAIASGTSHTITVPLNDYYGVHAVVVEAY